MLFYSWLVSYQYWYFLNSHPAPRRFSQDAEQIVVLENGVVAENGTHEAPKESVFDSCLPLKTGEPLWTREAPSRENRNGTQHRVWVIDFSQMEFDNWSNHDQFWMNNSILDVLKARNSWLWVARFGAWPGQPSGKRRKGFDKVNRWLITRNSWYIMWE